MSSPSNVNTALKVASQSLSAFAAIVSKTGCTSVGELLMTRRISLVAVCRSSDSVRSRLRVCTSVSSRDVLDGDRRLVRERLHQGRSGCR